MAKKYSRAKRSYKNKRSRGRGRGRTQRHRGGRMRMVALNPEPIFGLA